VQRRQRRGSIRQRELLAKVNKAEDQPDDNDNADNPENVVHSRSPKVVAPQIVRISFLYFLNVEFAVQRGTLLEIQSGTLPSLIRCRDAMGGWSWRTRTSRRPSSDGQFLDSAALLTRFVSLDCQPFDSFA
jgi:hypothetical protein